MCFLCSRILAGTIYFHIRKSEYFSVFKIEKTHMSGSNFEFLSVKNVWVLLLGVTYG